MDHLLGVPILGEYFIQKKLDDPVVVSPDHGGVIRARKLAERLESPIAIIDKRRPEPNVAEVMNIVGDVKENVASLSMISSTQRERSHWQPTPFWITVPNKCTPVYSPGFPGPAIQRIRDSKITEMVVANTIPLTEEKQLDKISVLSVAH